MEIPLQRGLFDERQLVQPTLVGETKQRVLIEGGFQDDWGRLHSVHPTELLIPELVTKINVRHKGSTWVKPLDLVYRWIDQYLIPTEVLSGEGKEEFNLFDYDGLQAVSSIIAADGRVFFDTTLFNDRSENNRRRLHRYLRVLGEKNNNSNPIDLFFTKAGQEKIRIQDRGDTRELSPIEIYNI